MLYSVWRPELKQYDYYAAQPALGDVYNPPPRQLRSHGELGLTPDEAAWPLPGDAKRVGQGVLARGMVATLNRGALGSFELTSTVGMLGLVLAAYGLWRVLR
jgi:hypothetical protein